ncbi:autotransporter outer membrane beta-barrel domain-containing protein [Pseudomonas sp. S2_E01]
MHASPSFAVTPLARILKWLAMGPLLFASPLVLGQTIIENGASQTIDGTTPVDDYVLRTGGQLTANGASTNQIAASESSLQLNGTTVTALGNEHGISLANSTATISQSKVTSNRSGLILTELPGGASQARVVDSEISGGEIGVTMSRNSEVTIEGSKISGTGANSVGILSFGGKLSVINSTIIGTDVGIEVSADNALPAANSIVLDKTAVQGTSGAAISVVGVNPNSEKVNIQVNNGSTLTGGNGVLLQVQNGASANFAVNNSQLVGDVVVEAGSHADVTLDNAATLTGRLENVENLAINNDARWIMVGDGSVENLALNGGGVQFGNPGQFFNLTVGELSGSGTFYMHNDFTTGQIDTLTVTGTATGEHTVALDSSGTEPTAAFSTAVVHIAAGDAQFSLLGGPVDLGTYSYDLVRVGANDWYLNAATRTISPGTQSVMALFSAARTVWYGELSTLRSRMGEVRLDHGKSGGWMRAYGNKYNVSESAGVAYKQVQQGVSFGADAPLPVGDGQWLVGVLAGYSKSDLDLSRGTSGDIDSYYLGTYATWLDAVSGYYFDGVIKYNRLQNDADVQLSDGRKTKGDYNNNGLGASAEFGRHIKLADDYFVEPSVQFAAVTFEGADYTFDNGLKAKGDRENSLLGKVGATVGRNYSWAEGKTVQPYVRAAYVHEFADNSDVSVNDNRFNTDLRGSRGELGAGVAITVTDKVSLHADFDYSNGSKIEQPWGANVGFRYTW